MTARTALRLSPFVILLGLVLAAVFRATAEYMAALIIASHMIVCALAIVEAIEKKE